MNFFTRLSQRSSTNGTAVAHVRLWHFIASVEEALQPSLRTVPFAVMSNARLDGRVIDANDQARALGARPGATALRLKQRFPTVQRRMYNAERVLGFQKAFYNQVKRWGRVVATDASKHAATITIPSVNALERAAVFLHVQEVCWKELECNIAVGIGSTVAFAKLAAMACVEPGFRYFDIHERQALNTLPVSIVAGIGKRTAQALVQLNVPTVRHFLQLDAQTVEQLGGRSLLRLYRQYIPVVGLPFVAPAYTPPMRMRNLLQSPVPSGALQ